MTESEMKIKQKIIVETLINENLNDCLIILCGVISATLCPAIQLGKISVEEANGAVDSYMIKVKAMFEFANKNKKSNPGFGLNQ